MANCHAPAALGSIQGIERAIGNREVESREGRISAREDRSGEMKYLREVELILYALQMVKC